MVEAFLSGLEAFHSRGGDVARVNSVASFFISRIDTKVDRLIDARLNVASPEEAQSFGALRGNVGIASAKIVYQHLSRTASARWTDRSADMVWT